MTCSPDRLEANRRNAQKSTGPKTEAGKARSRLNALRHGLAGAGDLVAPGEDLALIAARTEAFRHELGAPGAVGAFFAHRAAVLSVRMERAAEHNDQAEAARARAGRDAYDAELDDAIAESLADLIDAPDPRPILDDLAGLPQGVAHLIAAWRDLRAALAAGDPTAAERAVRWLGHEGPGRDQAVSTDLLTAIDVEVDRLVAAADSPALGRVGAQIAEARHQAGLAASFDPAPEAARARRYEAAAERGMYRAMRAIADLRRGQIPADLPESLSAPIPPSTPPVQTPAPAPSQPSSVAASSGAAPPMGSIRAGAPTFPTDLPTMAASRPEVVPPSGFSSRNGSGPREPSHIRC